MNCHEKHVLYKRQLNAIHSEKWLFFGLWTSRNSVYFILKDNEPGTSNQIIFHLFHFKAIKLKIKILMLLIITNV